MPQSERSAPAEIIELIQSLPDEQAKIVAEHAAMLRHYLDIGGPLSLLAFTLVSAELIAAEMTGQEGS